VLLFDEPLSNLDAKLRTEMRIEIKKLHTELKQTVVYVTHDQIEAMTMASRIAIMDRGVIQQIGSPDDVYERPANLFVARFIGAPAVNIFDTRISQADGKVLGIHEPSRTTFDLSSYCFSKRPLDGQRVALGVRPEAMLIENLPTSDRIATMNLSLRYGERTGSDATLFFETEGQLIAVKAEPSRIASIKPGERVAISVARAGLNVFDAENGQRM